MLRMRITTRLISAAVTEVISLAFVLAVMFGKLYRAVTMARR